MTALKIEAAIGTLSNYEGSGDAKELKVDELVRTMPAEVSIFLMHILRSEMSKYEHQLVLKAGPPTSESSTSASTTILEAAMDDYRGLKKFDCLYNDAFE